jgi:hypothetical protein
MFRLAEEADEFKDWSDPKAVGMPIFMPAKMSEDELDIAYGASVVNVLPIRTYDS